MNENGFNILLNSLINEGFSNDAENWLKGDLEK
jgi:hypothetical protein